MTLLAFLIPGHYEWIILLILGLLIFGRRLPEVGRSLGRGIVEFKRGIKGIDDEIDTESSRPAPPPEPRIAHRPAERLPDAPAPTSETSASAAAASESAESERPSG